MRGRVVKQHRWRSPRRMAGQGLTELVVCAAVLVPLFLLIPVVGKYAHANLMAQQAARNAAWEMTATPNHRLLSADAVQRKALERNFAAADAPIRSQTPGAAQGQFGDQLLNTFSGRKLLERDNLQVARVGQAASPGYVDEAARLLPRLPGGGVFPPRKDGYVSAEVQLQFRNLQTADGRPARYLAPFDRLNLVMTRKHSLLTDAWNASGPRGGARSVVATVTPLVPTTKIDGLDGLIDLLQPLKPILPPVGQLSDLDFGAIEPDIVPADKLSRTPGRR